MHDGCNTWKAGSKFKPLGPATEESVEVQWTGLLVVAIQAHSVRPQAPPVENLGRLSPESGSARTKP